MDSYLYSLDKCRLYLEGLNIDPNRNALWDILHIARWHKGIDWVLWLDWNKTLVEQIVQYESIVKIPAPLLQEIWKSVWEIKNTNR